MKACTKIFAARSGTGTQTVTGINDKDGNPFVGKLFLFHGVGALNSTSSGYTWFHGFDDLTHHLAHASSDVFTFGFKNVCNGGTSAGSITRESARVSFGGEISRVAYISAVTSGSFDLTYTTNTVTGDSIIVTVLGGDDLSTLVGRVAGTTSNPTITTGFPPEAILFGFQTQFASTGTAEGGCPSGFGWIANNSGQGYSTSASVNQGGNSRQQLTTACKDDLGTILQQLTDGFQASGASAQNTVYAAIGGAGILAAAGSLTQPGSTGVQTISGLGFTPRVVFLLSHGAVTGSSVINDEAVIVRGTFDSVSQAGFYTAEDSGGFDGHIHGSCRISSTDVLRFGTPNSASTSFTAVAESAGVSSGSFSINWTTVDGVSREVLYLAIGEVVLPSFASITVNKITNPKGNPTIFNFLAGGGLAPTTFSLSDGQTRIFDDITAGTYSIIEEGQSGWETTYTVSNGSPNDAITVVAGESIVVTVLNTFLGNPFSGMYYIKREKTDDTLFSKVLGSPPSLTETVHVKIPDPLSTTSLIGDE